jgi:cytochrome P450
MRTAERIESTPATAAPVTPGGWPVLGDLPAMRRRPLEFLSRAARQGDVVRMRLGRDVFLLNHPDHAQRVLLENHANYRKSFFYQRIRPLVGDGLVTSEGDDWKRKRRLAQPAFHRERLVGFVEVMAHHTGAVLDRWSEAAARGAPVDVSADMMRLTLTVVGHALFGSDLLQGAERMGRALTIALRITNQRFFSLLYLPPWLPTPANFRFARAMRVLDGVVNEIISARRGQPPRPDLLGMLMAAHDEEGGARLSDEELRDEVMTMLLAGHETTANALSWAFFLLARSPDVDARLHGECAGVLGGRAVRLEDLPHLGSAARAGQESMRLYPPIWAFGREAREPDVFGTTRVPAGAAVSVCPWLLHRDPRFWKEPERFDPDRFLTDAGRPRYAYLPFAAGPRMCIGNAFASMETQVVLSMVAARFRLALVPGRPVEAETSVTLRPRSGIWMTIHPRSGAHA